MKNGVGLYIDDMIGQGYSLAYGLYDGDELIGMSLGYIKHWYTGTEYYKIERAQVIFR